MDGWEARLDNARDPTLGPRTGHTTDEVSPVDMCVPTGTDLFPQLLLSAVHMVDLASQVYSAHPREEILFQRYLRATAAALENQTIHPIRHEIDLRISTAHLFTFFAAGTPGRELDALSMPYLPPSSHAKSMALQAPMSDDARIGTYRLSWRRGRKRPGVYEGVTGNGLAYGKFGFQVRYDKHAAAIARGAGGKFYKYANSYKGVLDAYATFGIRVEDKANMTKRALPKAARILSQYAVESVRHSWLRTVATPSPASADLVPHVGLNPRSSIGEAVARFGFMSADERKEKKAFRRSARNKISKASESLEQREQRLVVEREKERIMKAQWSKAKKDSYNQTRRIAAAKRIARETPEQAAKRRARHAAEERRRKERKRASENEAQK